MICSLQAYTQHMEVKIDAAFWRVVWQSALVAQWQSLPTNAGDVVLILELVRSPGEGHGDPLSILAWEIHWTEEPGRLCSMEYRKIKELDMTQ